MTLTFSPSPIDPNFCDLTAHLRALTPNSGLLVVTTLEGRSDPYNTQTVTTDACGNADSGLFSQANNGLKFNVEVDGVSSGYQAARC